MLSAVSAVSTVSTTSPVPAVFSVSLLYFEVIYREWSAESENRAERPRNYAD